MPAFEGYLLQYVSTVSSFTEDTGSETRGREYNILEIEMSAIVLIIVTATPNAHPCIRTYIVKRTVNTSIISGSTGCLGVKYVMNLICFFYICRHFVQLNLSTRLSVVNHYPTAFPYGNGMVLHFYQQQESSTTKTVHKVINKGLKTYV